jgi:hypothetical protein
LGGVGLPRPSRGVAIRRASQRRNERRRRLADRQLAGRHSFGQRIQALQPPKLWR